MKTTLPPNTNQRGGHRNHIPTTTSHNPLPHPHSLLPHPTQTTPGLLSSSNSPQTPTTQEPSLFHTPQKPTYTQTPTTPLHPQTQASPQPNTHTLKPLTTHLYSSPTLSPQNLPGLSSPSSPKANTSHQPLPHSLPYSSHNQHSHQALNLQPLI